MTIHSRATDTTVLDKRGMLMVMRMPSLPNAAMLIVTFSTLIECVDAVDVSDIGQGFHDPLFPGRPLLSPLHFLFLL